MKESNFSKQSLLLGFLALLVLSLSAVSCVKPTYDIRLMQMDKIVEQYLPYVKHRRMQLPSGQLKLFLTFRNTHPTRDVSADWRVVFYDQSGFEIEHTEWNTEIFPVMEEKTIVVNSISRAPADFLLQIRGSHS